MADSIPSLRALVNKLSAEIRELKAAPVKTVDRVITREVPVDRIVQVEKVVIKEVPVIQEKVITETVKVTVEKPVYQDNPEHIKTIRALQEKLCQFTSQ